MTVSQWADQYRYLSPETAAQPGKWRTSVVEFTRGIMDSMTDPTVDEVYFMKCAQVAWTESLLNAIGYFAHWEPAPHLLVQPTIEMAEDFSKDRIAPMIRDTPVLAEIFGDPKMRSSGNTLRKKPYPGGQLNLAGSNSPSSLASRPVRIFSGDEVDRWPFSAGADGNPRMLGKKRTQTFWNALGLYGSTPLIKGTSEIEAGFEISDKRFYWVPCPHCATFQVLKWSRDHVVWPKSKPQKAHYVCEHCNGAVYDKSKRLMVRHGQWRASEPFDGIAGFHIWSAYSPWVSFPELAKKWINAQGDPAELQVFVNVELAQTWEEGGEQLEPEKLYERNEVYTLPAAVLVITAGVDVQADRLELLFVGWGLGEESWALSSHVFWGDTTKTEVWDGLNEALSTTFEHPSGAKLGVACTLIDSGYLATTVYEFVRNKFELRIYASKGVAGPGRPIISAPTKNKQGELTTPVHLFTVGTDGAKGLIYARLRTEIPGPGYMHHHEEFDLEWFRQLTAERLKPKNIRGHMVHEWVLVRPNKRNEALDLWVLAMAAVKLINPIWHTLAQAMTPKTPDPAPVTPSSGAGNRFTGGKKWRIK